MHSFQDHATSANKLVKNGSGHMNLWPFTEKKIALCSVGKKGRVDLLLADGSNDNDKALETRLSE